MQTLHRSKKRRHLRHAALVVLTSGCLPMAGGPPPVALPDGQRQDIGFTHATIRVPGAFGIEDALHYRRAVTDRSELHVTAGAIIANYGAPYTMVGFRRYLVDRPGRTIGLGLSMGPFPLIAVPVAVQLPGRSLTLTTNPSVGVSSIGVFPTLPVGLTWQPRPHLQVHNALGVQVFDRLTGYWSTGVSVPF